MGSDSTRRLIAALAAALLASVLVLVATRASAQVTPETVIGLGSDWKYLDDGSDQGQAWSTSAYDDSAWASGPAELGYGDGDEATVVGFGGDPNDRYPTTYFRHVVSITNPHELINGQMRVERDDAAIVYVNGPEVWRSSNLPAAVNYLTYATGNAIENAFDTVAFDGSVLIDGPNIFAVEIHNRGAANSDISFDLELTADRDPSIPFPGPTMAPDAVEVGAGEPSAGDVSSNDAPNITYSLDPADLPNPATQGTLAFQANGTWTWTPVPGYSGVVVVPIQGCDAADPDFCGTRTLTISVRLPTAANDEYESPPNQPVTGDVSTNDASNGNGNLTWSLVGQAPDPGSEGTLAFNSDGTFTFTPVDSFFGAIDAQYQACDNQNDCAQANLRIIIAAPANIVINEIHFHPPCDVYYKPLRRRTRRVHRDSQSRIRACPGRRLAADRRRRVRLPGQRSDPRQRLLGHRRRRLRLPVRVRLRPQR